MDRLESMGVFVRVSATGSFAAVAADLRLSPTMIAKHIRALEERLGARLINRTTRRQSLTEAGTIYLERCRQLLAAAAAAENSVEVLRETPRGVLRVASPVTFGSQRLAPALAAYLMRNPEISVELTLSDRAVDLVDEGYDAVIRIGKLEDSALIACPLQPYRMLIAAAPDYLARRGTPRKPAELARHNCLGFMYWDRRSTWRLTGPAGDETVRVQGNFTVNHGQALRMAALAGVGIVLQPEALLADDIAAKRLVAVLPGFAPGSRPMHLVYLPDRRVTPKLRSFIDFVVAQFGLRAEGHGEKPAGKVRRPAMSDARGRRRAKA